MPKKKKHSKGDSEAAKEILDSFYTSPNDEACNDAHCSEDEVLPLTPKQLPSTLNVIGTSQLPNSPKAQPQPTTFSRNDNPSWAELVGKAEANNSNIGIPLTQMEKCEGKLILPAEALYDIDKEWGACLIGFFPARFPGKTALLQMCSKWNVTFEYRPHQNGWLIFKFDSEADCNKVLHGGPYFVYGRSLLLKRMPPHFHFGSKELKQLPVWVTFPGLPFSYWKALSLSYIASQIGKPIQTDGVTKLGFTQASYARVLIEIDTTLPLKRSLLLGLEDGSEFEQEIIYEHEPKLCSICKGVGHSAASCRYASIGPPPKSRQQKSQDAIKGKQVIPPTKNVDAALNKAGANSCGEGSSFSEPAPLAKEDAPVTNLDNTVDIIKDLPKLPKGAKGVRKKGQPNPFQVLDSNTLLSEDDPLFTIADDPPHSAKQTTTQPVLASVANSPPPVDFQGDLISPNNPAYVIPPPKSVQSTRGRNLKGGVDLVGKTDSDLGTSKVKTRGSRPPDPHI